LLLFPVILRKNLGRLTGFVVIKSQLILRIAGQNPHLFQRDVVKVVDAILDQIVSALAQGDRVELRGFGSFSAKLRGVALGEIRKPALHCTYPKKSFLFSGRARKITSGSTPMADPPETTLSKSSNSLPIRNGGHIIRRFK
jgi:integration host factor subunit beta